MEVVERFVINDLPDNYWSVSWPGYEEVVVNNTNKAANLLKILFDEVGVDNAILGLQHRSNSEKFETMHISWIAWHQNPEAAARHSVDYYLIVGCKFAKESEAREFKLIMERRLAWKRLSGGKAWA